MEIPPPRRRLGEVLVALGFCSAKKMQEALKTQAEMKAKRGYALRLGHLLLQDEAINERQLAICLAAQFETACVDLVGVEVDLGLLKRMPRDALTKHCFVPLAMEEEGLRVSIEDIPEPALFAALEEALHCPVQYVISPASQVQRIRAYCEQQIRRGLAGALARTVFPEEFFTCAEEEASSKAVVIGPTGGGAATTAGPAADGSPGGSDSLVDSLLDIPVSGLGEVADDDPLDQLLRQKAAAPASGAPAQAPSAPKKGPPSDEAAIKTQPGKAKAPVSAAAPAPTADKAAPKTPGKAAAPAPGPESTPIPASQKVWVDDEPTSEAGPTFNPEEASAVGPTFEPDGAPTEIPGLESDPLASKVVRRALKPAPSPDSAKATAAVSAPAPKPPAQGPTEAPKPSAPPSSPPPQAAMGKVHTAPPLSRIQRPLPSLLQSFLHELSVLDCHCLSVVPHSQGADVIHTDDDGSRVLSSLNPGEYQEMLRQSLALLDLGLGELQTAERQKVELSLAGETYTFRLWALPSDPPTLSFSMADRDSVARRRQLRLESSVVEAIRVRARLRRGLVIITADDASEAESTLAGLVSVVQKEKLRVAWFSRKSGIRLREVSHFEVDADSESQILDQERLVFVAESGIDVMAFNLPLDRSRLNAVVPLAAVEATVLLTLQHRDTLEALSHLVAAGLPVEVLAATLEMAVSVHRANRLCPFCRRPQVLAEAMLPAPLRGTKLANAVVFESIGCRLCGGTGVRGTASLYEVLTWDRDKAPAATLAMDRKSLMKRCYELGLMRPVTLEARKAMLGGVIGFPEYLRILGMGRS